MRWSTDPSKNIFNPPPPQFHDKTVQSDILRLNLSKIKEVSILQSADKQGNPSFHFHALGSNANTHALKQHRLSRNMSPVCSSFVLVIASDMHLEPESEKRLFSHIPTKSLSERALLNVFNNYTNFNLI